MIRDIDPERRLYTMDPLQRTHQVKRIKMCQPDGTMLDNEEAAWRDIAEYKLVKSAEALYCRSAEGSRISRIKRM